MAQVKCPICGVKFEATATHATAPFCSPRCKQIDLGRWLGEKYSVPVQRPHDDEEERPGENQGDESEG